MKSYNESQGMPLYFSGFDMQHFEGPAAELYKLLPPSDTALLGKIVDELDFAQTQAREGRQRHKSFSPL